MTCPRRLLLGLFGTVVLALPAPALAGEQTLTFRTAAISVEGYGVTQATQLIESPRVDGYVVDFSAVVVDEQGNVQTDRDIMLHHVVVAKLGKADYTCPGLQAERFYAQGEETTKLALPPGFGYPNRAGERWAMLYMLMNHHAKPLKGYVRYTVRYVTGEDLTPVKPVWLDIRNCRTSEFDVPGTGAKGSSFTQSAEFTMPEAGTFVAGGGHLHGGGIRLELRNATCGATPFASLPTWGKPIPKPILHEPGPARMSSFSSPLGIPVAAGERLQLAAVYDNDKPHTRVMGIMLLYLAPGQGESCRPIPQLAIELGRPGAPPPFSMPLPRKPTGKLQRDLKSTWVGDFRFGAERVSLKRGATFTWRFIGRVPHDVTLISGPIGFSSPPSQREGTYTQTFTRTGEYRLFCSLHPTRMVQQISVRKR